MTEFLVEFELQVPAGTPQPEVNDRQKAESDAAAKLADEGHLVRLWRRPQAGDGTTAVGLYRADNEARLDALLADLPLADWLRITVTPLEPHPNDPPGSSTTGNRLPGPKRGVINTQVDAISVSGACATGCTSATGRWASSARTTERRCGWTGSSSWNLFLFLRRSCF